MHGKQANPTKNRAPMICYHSHKQLSLAEFDWPFQTALDENNRWVKMSQCIPWDALAEGYYQGLSTTQGRPKKVTEANREELKQLKAQRREEYLQRIPIEGKFGQGKNGYRLNYIRAKRADTSYAWINSIFLVMNLLILLRIFFALCKRGFAVVRMPLLQVVERLVHNQLAHDTRRRGYLFQMATY
jgi:hypothetical protein